ncbi:MAG TPA: hypothetical protein P5057_12355, partial [Acidobacteriota bacterium]|nr:hypothetical protein [Acidobacteriota bacterium]
RLAFSEKAPDRRAAVSAAEGSTAEARYPLMSAEDACGCGRLAFSEKAPDRRAAVSAANEEPWREHERDRRPAGFEARRP